MILGGFYASVGVDSSRTYRACGIYFDHPCLFTDKEPEWGSLTD